MFETLFSLWRPVSEIVLIWALVYWLMRFFIGTRVAQVFVGLVILAVIFNIAKLLDLNAVIWVLSKLFAVGVVAFLIIFQPEMRRGLARLGQKTIGRTGFQPGGVLDEVVKATQDLARRNHGALIALERGMSLRDEVEGGMDIDARVTADLIISIFDPHTPTHDGGVIIAGGRITCSGAFFPLSSNPDLAPSLGTRHRAALGLTEDSDAVCLIVSEETHSVSIAQQGSLSVPLDSSELRKRLKEIFEAQAKDVPQSGLLSWLSKFLSQKGGKP
jgi:diadenylate cyclase